MILCKQLALLLAVCSLFGHNIDAGKTRPRQDASQNYWAVLDPDKIISDYIERLHKDEPSQYWVWFRSLSEEYRALLMEEYYKKYGFIKGPSTLYINSELDGPPKAFKQSPSDDANYGSK